MSAEAGGSTVHASAIVVGEHGILIRGPAGSGKSSLARELVAAAESAGRYGALVADDRVALAAMSGRLVASAPQPISGLLEIRGIGIVRVPHAPAAVLRLVVDLERGDPARMAETDGLTISLFGIELPRIVVNRTSALGVVAWRFGVLPDRFMTVS